MSPAAQAVTQGWDFCQAHTGQQAENQGPARTRRKIKAKICTFVEEILNYFI